MKKHLLFFLFLTLTTFLSAQSEKAKELMTSNEFIEEEIKGIEWKTEKYFDLGDIPQNKPVTVDFVFENLDDEPILITRVESSCSCFVSDFSKEPIMKGAKGSIKASFDAKAEGPFFKTFLVLTSRSTSPNVLFIKGNVR